MTSYQKLKAKCEYLQSQVDIFKNALTVARQEPQLLKERNGNYSFVEKIAIQRNKIYDERIKQELTKWVAENLDKKTIKHLLKTKEKLEK